MALLNTPPLSSTAAHQRILVLFKPVLLMCKSTGYMGIVWLLCMDWLAFAAAMVFREDDEGDSERVEHVSRLSQPLRF